jgi:peptide/nickel transport system substrate-binding protein
MALAACSTPSAQPSTAQAPVSGNAPAQPAARKQIVVAIAGEPSTLSATINQAGSGGVAGVSETELLIGSGMVDRSGADGTLYPVLGEAVPTIENGQWKVLADGRMETTHTIKANAAWHDGVPLTTDDLVFSVQVGMDQEVGLLNNPGFRSLESIKAQDARTVVVTWKQPFIQADTLFSNRFAFPLPKHILGPIYDQDKAALVRATYWTQDYVGTGPFKLREFISGAHMTLLANEAYVLGRPKIDQLELRFIQDANAQIASLLSGEVQMTMGRRLSIEQGQQAAAQWTDGRMLVSTQNWIALFPQFLNPQPPVVGQLPFRRALQYATDRQQMSDALSGGLSPVADSPVAPGQPEAQFVQNSIVHYAYDPRQAAQLIEGLGYTKGADGHYVDGSGKLLSIELRTTAGDDFRQKMITTIADNWQRAGITVEQNFIPRQRADDQQYRAERPAFELVRQPNDLNRLYSREVPTDATGYRGNNRTRLASPELDAIIDRYYTTIPMQQRMDALSDFVHFTTDQLIVMGELYNAEPLLVSNRIKNVAVAKADGSQDSWNSRDWELD